MDRPDDDARVIQAVTGDPVDIRAVEDPSAACTRADVNVGGAVQVTLRGPPG